MKKLTVIMVLMAVILLSRTFAFAETGVLKRSDVEDQYKWNLEDIYQDQEAVKADLSKLKNKYIPEMKKFNGKLTSGDSLLKCLQLRDDMMRLMDKLYVYAHMKSDENMADNAASELSSQTDALYAEVLTATAFIGSELLTYPENTIKEYMSQPALQDYKLFLDALLKQKAHTLSRPEEELLAALADFSGSPSSIYDKLRVADMTYPEILDENGAKVQLSPGIYAAALESKNRDYRKRAFEGTFSSFAENKNTFAALIEGEVKKNIFFAKARKYDSALEASLTSEFIPVQVYDNLVKAVNDNTGYLHKYVDLRKKVLGLDKVHIYDMYVPLVKDYEIKIPYEEAKKMLLEGLKPLGDDYIRDLQKGFDSRWIDVYETENKATGGYQWGAYDTHPYVLLNQNDSADAMLTLAHEMGHALNHYYTCSTQKYTNSGIPIFTAEVASTTNEILMLKYLIAHAQNDDEKLYFINSLVELIRGNVYTQVMYAEFEKTIHERVEKGGALSAETLRGIWKSLMVKYYGENFEADELADMWWARVPHFYMDFYVYKYATAISAANEMVENMTGTEGDTASAKAKYLEFLKAGSSDYPIEVLKAANVDMTSTRPVDDLLAEFGKLVDEMERIMEKKNGK